MEQVLDQRNAGPKTTDDMVGRVIGAHQSAFKSERTENENEFNKMVAYDVDGKQAKYADHGAAIAVRATLD